MPKFSYSEVLIKSDHIFEWIVKLEKSAEKRLMVQLLQTKIGLHKSN